MAKQYLERIDAQKYFDCRLNTSAWDYASPTDQNKALAQATRMIDTLNYLGRKWEKTQENEFPRFINLNVIPNDDPFQQCVNPTPPAKVPLVPERVLNACAEIALALLDDYDVDREARSVNMKEFHFSNVRTQRATEENPPDWILAGIPSPTAWNLLKPFLVDPFTVTLDRTN